MTLFEIEEAIAEYLEENWDYTSIRIINKDDSPSLPYIECWFKPGQMTNLEVQGVGARAGVFMINIFTKKGVGTYQGFSYGDELEKLFWHKTISGVICEDGFTLPYTKFIGIDSALQACHHQTVIPFSIITEI